ncbi:MAG TPA: hypothetical protein VIK55_02645 [Paludibacter sp.]
MKAFKPEEALKKKVYEDNKMTLHNDFIETKTVLGIDIYKYSEYPPEIQTYIPVLFNELYKLTTGTCIKKENFIFQKYGDTIEHFKSHFISTGDGGFQIFDNPLQALTFVIYFQAYVRRLNSKSYTSKIMINLCNIIGKIELRYTISTDKIYSYDNNFYGPAIINNARILAKDHLNRLLLDSSSLDWFDLNINTVENLLVFAKNDLMKSDYFADYDIKKESLLFDENIHFTSVDILKIGNISSKNTILDVYNLKIQVRLEVLNKTFVITIGNLNTQGIQ